MVEALPAEIEALAALPQLGASDLLPEVTGLKLAPDGRLLQVEKRAPLIITYTEMGRRVTGRFSTGATPCLEIGCRLARIPYAVEGPVERDRLLATVGRIQKASVGRLGITHRRELHIRDEVLLDRGGLGAEAVLLALVVAGLSLRPVFRWLDELALPLP